MNNLPLAIEAILFSTSDEWSLLRLAKVLEVSIEDIEQALTALEAQLDGHSIMLVRMADTVTLATRTEYTGIIATIRRDELQKDLSKASAETLAVIVYTDQTQGVSKAHIEMVRGVNVTYSLRQLQMRGLIEAVGSGRAVLYKPTLALLQSFGVSSIDQLPSYQETIQKITAISTQHHA